MPSAEDLLEQARQLTSRLERLSADSHWARRASGYRASLLKAIERVEALLERSADPTRQAEMEIELSSLSCLLQHGHLILERAAKDLVRRRLKPQG